MNAGLKLVELVELVNAVGIGVAVVDSAIDEMQVLRVAYMEMQASAKQNRKYSVRGTRQKFVWGQQTFVELCVGVAGTSCVGCFGFLWFLQFEGRWEMLRRRAQCLRCLEV